MLILLYSVRVGAASELFSRTLTAAFLQAFQYAREGLSLHIYGLLEDGEKLPAPSRLESIKLSGNEALTLIEVDLKEFEPDWSQS